MFESYGRPPRRRNVTTPHAAEGSPQATWSRGPGRARGARCSAFAESSRSCAERHDLALMQPLLPMPASDEYSVTLAVLDLHCATNVYPELCTLGFLQASGLLKESWSSPRLLLLMVQRSWPRSRNRCSAFAESSRSCGTT